MALESHRAERHCGHYRYLWVPHSQEPTLCAGGERCPHGKPAANKA